MICYCSHTTNWQRLIPLRADIYCSYLISANLLSATRTNVVPCSEGPRNTISGPTTGTVLSPLIWDFYLFHLLYCITLHSFSSAESFVTYDDQPVERVVTRRKNISSSPSLPKICAHLVTQEERIYYS